LTIAHSAFEFVCFTPHGHPEQPSLGTTLQGGILQCRTCKA